MTTQGIVSIADTSLGYGTPQTPWFLQSLAQHYGTRAFVIEPDELHRPPTALPYDRLDVLRVPSPQRSYALASYLDRNWRLEEHLRGNDAPIWVVFSPLQLALLSRLKRKPRYVIYYCLEIGDSFYERTLRRYGHLIDHIVYPELDRAAQSLKSLQIGAKAKASILYNVSRRAADFAMAPKRPRILYSGSISWRYTFADDFVKELKDFPIDIYGPVDSAERKEIGPSYERIRNAPSGVSYKGYVAGDELRRLLPSYAYSIVRWNPEMGLNCYFACPNKFFEGIAHGVPPIAAPHPQCVQILRKYECGILAKDFTVGAMAEALERAMGLFETPSYDRMVQNCLDAYSDFLNWDAQFMRFAKTLPSREEMGL